MGTRVEDFIRDGTGKTSVNGINVVNIPNAGETGIIGSQRPSLMSVNAAFSQVNNAGILVQQSLSGEHVYKAGSARNSIDSGASNLEFERGGSAWLKSLQSKFLD